MGLFRRWDLCYTLFLRFNLHSFSILFYGEVLYINITWSNSSRWSLRSHKHLKFFFYSLTSAFSVFIKGRIIPILTPSVGK